MKIKREALGLPGDLGNAPDREVVELHAHTASIILLLPHSSICADVELLPVKIGGYDSISCVVGYHSCSDIYPTGHKRPHANRIDD